MNKNTTNKNNRVLIQALNSCEFESSRILRNQLKPFFVVLEGLLNCTNPFLISNTPKNEVLSGLHVFKNVDNPCDLLTSLQELRAMRP